MTLQVQGLQLDDGALLTVKDGEELVCSGHFKIVREYADDEMKPRLDVDFQTAGVVTVRVLEVVTDPENVGAPSRPGQRRIWWRGEMEAD